MLGGTGNAGRGDDGDRSDTGGDNQQGFASSGAGTSESHHYFLSGQEDSKSQKATLNMVDASKKSKIRLLVADDHPIVRAGIRSFLANDGRIEVVGEASDGREALAQARELLPDVVFMDIYMPRMNGLVAAKLLSRQMPDTKVLMHTLHDDQAHVLQIIRSGAGDIF